MVKIVDGVEQSGGASSVSTLTDVKITEVADNDLLAYDSSTSKYTNQSGDEANLVDKSSTQTIGGAKTFSTFPLVSSGAIRKLLHYDVSTTPYTAGTNSETIILVTCSSANITINLPAVATSADMTFLIKKVDATAYTVIIDGNSSEKIDGSNTHTLYTQYHGVEIYCDGAAWHIMRSLIPVFTSTGYIYPLLNAASAQDWGATTGHDVVITDADADSTSADSDKRTVHAVVIANNSQTNVVTFPFFLPPDFSTFASVVINSKVSAIATCTATVTLRVNEANDATIAATTLVGGTTDMTTFTLTPGGTYTVANANQYCELVFTLGGNAADTVDIRKDCTITYNRVRV